MIIVMKLYKWNIKNALNLILEAQINTDTKYTRNKNILQNINSYKAVKILETTESRGL